MLKHDNDQEELKYPRKELYRDIQLHLTMFLRMLRTSSQKRCAIYRFCIQILESRDKCWRRAVGSFGDIVFIADPRHCVSDILSLLFLSLLATFAVRCGQPDEKSSVHLSPWENDVKLSRAYTTIRKRNAIWYMYESLTFMGDKISLCKLTKPKLGMKEA